MPIILTTAVVGQADVNRLLRELNSLDDFFIGAQARQAGTPIAPPKTTVQLDELAKLNKLNLLEAVDRAKLTKQLKELNARAPKIQVSFAVEPPPRVVEIILGWMRDNLHPNILLQVGLQPNIGAGIMVRTANREFDLSMRQHLLDSHPYLAELIEAAVKKMPEAPAPATAPAQPKVTPQPPPLAQPLAQPLQPAAQPQRQIEVNNG